jgi:hypothetical protein
LARSSPCRGAEHLERREQRARREDRRVAHGPAGGAGAGAKLGQHLEARLRFVAPPARQREGAAEMPLVHEAPPIAPGPAFRYLYEHHTAKSTSQSCSAAAGCRWHAQIETGDGADACAARAMRAQSNAWPVRYCTPGHSTSASSLPQLSIFASMSSMRSVSSPARGADLDQRCVRSSLCHDDCRGSRGDPRRTRRPR